MCVEAEALEGGPCLKGDVPSSRRTSQMVKGGAAPSRTDRKDEAL